LLNNLTIVTLNKINLVNVGVSLLNVYKMWGLSQLGNNNTRFAFLCKLCANYLNKKDFTLG